MAQREALQQAPVKSVVRALGVVQELAALSHHHQKTAAGSMVMLVADQVLSQVSDALRKHGYLETGGAGVLLVNLEVIDINIAHVFNLVLGLIFRGCGKSTGQGEGIIPIFLGDASQISFKEPDNSRLEIHSAAPVFAA